MQAVLKSSSFQRDPHSKATPQNWVPFSGAFFPASSLSFRYFSSAINSSRRNLSSKRSSFSLRMIWRSLPISLILESQRLSLSSNSCNWPNASFSILILNFSEERIGVWTGEDVRETSGELSLECLNSSEPLEEIRKELKTGFFLHRGHVQVPEHEGHNQVALLFALSSQVAPLNLVPKQFLQTILLHVVQGRNSLLYWLREVLQIWQQHVWGFIASKRRRERRILFSN